MDKATLLDLIPAYALGALDTEEHAAVESLLAADAEAQALLAEYQATADLIVLTTPARRAPAHLTADLRQRLAASRPPAAPPAPVEPPLSILPPTNQRNWLPLALGMAAAVAIVLAGVLLLMRGTAPNPAAELYAQIVAQADVRRTPVQGMAAATATGEMVATADGTKAVIKVSQLSPLAADKTFQLWLIDDSGPRSGGLFVFDKPDTANYIVVPLDKPVSGYKSFAVSIEPKGGSPNPKAPSGDVAFGVNVAS
jgi:anti-sigma-K factor RskA